MGGCGDGGCDKGGEKELIEAVLTCEGNISDPDLPLRLSHLVHHLQVITESDDNWLVRKVEPWNSVRVTFSIPKEAALRLHQLAQAGDAALQQLGILSVQVEGDQIVSLKVAGPNNETTEILIRTVNEGAGPSGENVTHGSVAARPLVQALGGSNILPSSFNPQHHQPHPVPQFRSPSSVSGSDAVSVVVGRLPVVQHRPQVQPYSQTYSGINASSQLHSRHMQQLQLQPPPHLQPQAPPPPPPPPQPPSQISSSGLHHGLAGSTSPLSSGAVARPSFPPTNPPPPYPREEVRPLPMQQVANISQTNGQPYVANQTINNVNSVNSNTPPTPQSHTQINSVVQQPVTVNYRLTPSSQVSAANNSPVVTPSRVPPGRTQVNMVKNSPLLVGLLQQPDQTSVTGVRNIKNNLLSAPPNVCVSSNSISVENGPLPTILSSLPSSNSSSLSSTGTYVGRSRDGLTTHQQIYSGGSVITNSPIPPPPPPPQRQHMITGGFHQQQQQQQQQQPQSIVMPISASGARVQHLDEQRRPMGTPPVSLGVSNKVGSSHLVHMQGVSHESCVPTNTPLLNTKLMGVGDGSGETTVQSHASKKESQYLINPNTGLLEPRPNTDSSDSETEGQTISSSHDDQLPSSVASDDESNLSNTSRKEIDHPDSDMSRITTCVESRKFIRGKSRDKDSSPISSWENNVGSNPGEKIKLRLKLGKEQVAQATIVGTAKLNESREFTSSSGCNTLPSISEPRVPKLHIKLHSSQPVIVKTAEEMESGNRLSTNKELGKEKAKRNRSRSKLKTCNSDVDPFKSKNFRLKANRDKLIGEDVTSQVLKILEPKITKSESDFDNSLIMKFRESPDMRLKVPRLQELSKPSSKLDNSKLRTRLKKPNMRKVGDLNSVGEITSHTILETLPPSITKVAAMHTQHPHRNPSSSSPSSPVPLSSITPSLFSNFSLSSSNISPNSSNDQLKAELEKRGSEIIPKSEVRIEGENDILMTKVRLHPSIMNGDIPHSDKLSLNSMRYKRPSPSTLPSAPGEFASNSKLTIKRQRSDEMHSLDTLKKEGLGNVPTFLNSSVLINKVQSEKSLPSNLAGSQRQSEDFSEKFLNKVGGEITGLKSNSDITIHSLSKKDSLRGLNKGSEIDRSPSLTLKPKAEITKVGRVTCVDVMDRKALEEALKSSRNSSKKSEVIFSTKSTSSMVDRLRRWNSIDSSSASVPFSSHSQQQAGESTNLSSMGVRVEPKEPAKNDSEKQSLGLSNAMMRNNNSVAQQANTVNNVNIKSNCDNSGNDNVDSIIDQKVDDETKELKAFKLESLNDDCRGIDINNINKAGEKLVSPCSGAKASPITNHVQCSLSSISLPIPSKSNENDHCKISELINPASIIKAEVDSPEGTPKGEHGNGQGGEDSGIESMDALSEKSPNHSDQSPNRREEKECEIFSRDKIKEGSPVPINSKMVENKVLVQEGNAQDTMELKESKQYFRSKNNAKCFETHSSFHKENSDGKSISCEGDIEETKSNTNCDLVTVQPCPENLTHSENDYSTTLTEKDISDVAAHIENNDQSNEPQMEASKEPSECLPAKFDNLECNSSLSPTKNSESDASTGRSYCDANDLIAPSFVNSSTGDLTEALHVDLTNSHFNDSSFKLKNSSQEKSNNASTEIFKPDLEADTFHEIVSLESNDENIYSQSKFIEPDVTQENLELDNKTRIYSPTNIAITSEILVDSSIPNDAFFEDLSTDKIKQLSEHMPASQYEMEDFQLLESSLESQLMEMNKIPFSDHSLPVTSVESSADVGLSAAEILSAVCSATISIPTTTICVTSPKCNLAVSPSGSTHCSPVPTSTSCSENSMQLETSTKDLSLTNLINSKPPVVAITLSRPTGALMTAQFAPSVTNSIVEKISPMSLLTKSGNTLTSISQSAITTVSKHFQHRIEGTSSPSIVFCHSISCNNNSLAYSNSYSTNTTSTNATMIILAASSSNSGSVLSTPCNSTKVVTLKPGGISQSTKSSSLNPPVGKTFRLVALPGINSMNPAASPVKGQLVTLKPVVGTGVTTTIAQVKPQLLQTMPTIKSEESNNSSLLKTHLSSPIMSPVDSSGTLRPDSAEGQLEDLDFVGFCSSAGSNEATSKQESLEDNNQSNHVEDPQSISSIETSNSQLVSAEILSPTEEEPKPMRVHPPLYTYGNRERKKEMESDAEEKEKEDAKESSMPTAQLPPPPLADKSLESEKEDDDSKLNDLNMKFKDKNLDALTIEIPNTEAFPEDKRLTRSARQNARLSSPKINSPGGELSPRNDKRNVPSSQVMCKPSPLGVLRSSTSPALRCTKRRRHESESSSTSTLSEDLQEPTPKVSRRKQNDKIVLENKEDSSKNKTGSSFEFPKDGSSDEESLGDEELSKKHNQLTPASSTNDEEDENRPKKNGTRSRDKSAEEFKMRSSRDTTPTRRTPRQNRNAIPSTASTGVISASTSATMSTITISNQQTNLADKDNSLPLDSLIIEQSTPNAPIIDILEESSTPNIKITSPSTPRIGSEKESEKKVFEKKFVSTSGSKEVVIKALVKGKREFENELDSLSGRRKTRSTTSNTGEDSTKRRKIGKDNKL